MQTKLKQHLAIATGAVSAAAVPMGADAAIVYKDDTNAFSVSYAGPDSAQWDIDGAGVPDFNVWNNNDKYLHLSSAAGQNGRGLVNSRGGDNFNALAAGFALEPTLATSYSWAGNGNLSARSIMS